MTKTWTAIAAGALIWAAPAFSMGEDKDTKDAKEIPDLVKDSIDPYVPGTERGLFLKAAGVDSELDESEFEANAKAQEPFIRSFDKWAAMLKFDKNGDKKIDWFEADAYRRDLRTRMLAEFDKNKDTKLEGAEREEANKLLASGKLPRATPVGTTPRVDGGNDNPRPRRGGGEERRREELEKWDKDGDGQLSREERKDQITAAIKDGRERQIRKWDENGDGILDESERAKVMEDRQDQWWLRFDDIGMKHFDADGDGKLSESESRDIVAFGEELEKVGKNWEVKLLDTDGDGEVSAAERREMQGRMQIIGITMLPEAMKWVDTDGDGRPSPQEMEAVARRAAEAGKKELDKWVKRYDKNNDGRLDATERSAFVKGIDEDIAARFKRNDKDGDGKLSDSEIRSIIEELAEEYDVKPKKQAF
jgi:Ca2+-binding EF-hand superfamily protein